MKYDGRTVLLSAAFVLAAVFLAAVYLPAGAAAETLTCIVADGQYVNVRNRASSQAATWGVMHTGETIEADPAEIADGFFKTMFKERVAYVSVRYFEIPVDAHYIVQANGRVRLRKSPGGDADGFIQPGARVYVTAWRYASDGSKWAKCTGGQYISAEYLVDTGEGNALEEIP